MNNFCHMSHSLLVTVIATVLASSLFCAPLLQYSYSQANMKNMNSSGPTQLMT